MKTARMKRLTLPAGIALFIAFILSMMELQMDESLMLLNRFYPGAGWIQVVILTLYGGFLGYKMQDAGKSGVWRRRSWLIFSVWFFSQFFLGIFADERFLMTGELHLPLPFMIAAGPVYRAQMTIMPILLLSSIVLTGPAWCSHYCYFGAIDQTISRSPQKIEQSKPGYRKLMRTPIKNRWIWKSSALVVFILTAWLFRMLGFSGLQTLVPALAAGSLGIVIMLYFSRKKGKMVHCVSFCPIGTLVNFGKYISPFRMEINSACTNCMLCIPSCSYDALNPRDIENRKPGILCTYCGDCITSCQYGAIRYRFFRLKPAAARNLYLFLTITLHVLCLGLARI